MANLIGQRLGQYEVIALLGEGGMAAVYRAHQASMKRDVAIKVIKTGLLQMGDFVKRFEREAQTVASLNHPHILKVFDYGQHGDMVYLVMELQVGGSLADLLRNGPLPLDIASRALDQIASALDYAHERGIIHRDLKPQNVLLDEKRNAILTDFGIAKILNDSAALTQSGVAMGTPAYMSPEQWQGRPLDARTDVYALGIMLFEMLTGRQPFGGETPPALMYMHLTEQPPLLSKLRPDLPDSVQQVLSKALAKDAGQRFGSAGEMAEAFKEALAGQATALGRPTRPVQPDTRPAQPDMPTLAERPTPADVTVAGQPPEAPKKRSAWPVLAAVVLLIAIGVVLVVLSRGGLGAGPTPGAASATSTAAVVVVPTTVVPTAGTPAALQTRAAATNKALTATPFIKTFTSTSTSFIKTFTSTSTSFIKTFTSTPGPAATNTPFPLPISGVNVTFRDDFDGNRLSDAWYDFGVPPAVKDGMLIFTGRDRWDDGIARPTIHENSGALLLLQYEPGSSSSISLDSGDYSKDNFRQLRIQAEPQSGTIISASGVQGATTATHGQTAMRPGTWYYLLFRIGENGSFYTQLWERDKPSVYLLNVGVTPPGEDWAKRDWASVIHTYHGVLKVDAYWEVGFPAGYRLPGEGAAIPPLLGTATPTPVAAIPGVVATFRDDFDGNRLSDVWNVWQARPPVDNGMLVFAGQNRWGDGIARGPLHDGDGALLLFQYEPGEIQITLDSGDYNNDTFRQWGVTGNQDTWVTFSSSGLQGVNNAAHGEAADMRPGIWYYLLLRVGENGRFYTQVWRRDDPSAYVLNVSAVPPGDNWSKREWAFAIQPHDGSVKADTYWELHFPANFQMPDRPPQALALAATATYTAAVATQPPGAARTSAFKLAFVPAAADPFYAMVQKGIEQAASDFGAEVVVQVPAQVNAAAQADSLKALRDKNINALIVAPADPAKITSDLEAAHQQGMQVISIDVPLGDANYASDRLNFMLAHVGSDPQAGGRVACETLAQSIGKKGKVYLQNGGQGSPAFDARERGCRDALARYPDIKLVGVDNNEFNPDKAEAQLKAVLQREGSLAGIFATGSFGVAGIGKAVVGAGLKGQVKIAVIDAHPEVIDAVRAGIVTFAFAQRPYDIGYLAAAYALARLNGVGSVPKLTLTGMILINSENVSSADISRFFYTSDIGKPLPPLSNATVGFVPGVEHPFYRAMENGVNNAARLLGLKVITRVPPQWDPAVQASTIQAVVGENVNALIAVPADAGMVPVFEAVDKRGIPVITVDTFIGDGNYADGPVKFPLSYIGTDSVGGGHVACEVLAESIGKKGKVYIQDVKPGPDPSPRAKGCQEALARYPDIKLVGVEFNDGDTGKSEAQTAAVLDREKDLTGIFVINLSAVEGTGKAVARAGKKDTVRLVAFDSTADNMAALKAGVLSAVIAQRPSDMGFLAVICAVAKARGVDSFPRRVPTELVIINADNMNDPGIASLIY